MDTVAANPGLSADAPAKGAATVCSHCGGACPQCGARVGGIADPRAEEMAVLAEVRDLGVVLLRALVRQAERTGEAGAAEQQMYDSVSRSVRRASAMRVRIYENSVKSPERRHAENLRRIDAEVRAQVGTRKAAIVRTMEDTIRAHVAERGGDTERLLCDMHEQLFDADIARVSTKREFDEFLLGLCHGMGIVPRDTTLSDVATRAAIHETKMEVDCLDADRIARNAAAAEQPFVISPKETRDYPKIGPFTFNSAAAIVSKDRPPDTG